MYRGCRQISVCTDPAMCMQKHGYAPRTFEKCARRRRCLGPSFRSGKRKAGGGSLSWAACVQDGKGEGLAGGDHHSSPAPKEEVKESLGKKKKGQKQQTLLFTTTQRRY